MHYTLQAEEPAHAAGIEEVLNRAFGPGRFAKTSERVRERGARPRPSLSRVAVREDGSVAGVCRIFSVEAGGASLLFLGPLAVDPVAQHVGLGADLVRACLAAGRAAAENGVVCVGAAAFFEPLGFSIVPQGQLTMPGPVDPQRFLWAALQPGGLDRIAGAITAPRAASPA
ncbi:MAG: GNAT family N-acetyltransferase [Hyphomonadaceae bacterium]